MIHPIHCETNNTFYNKFSHASRLFLSPEQSPAPVQFANLNRQSSGTVTVTCSYLWTSSGPDTTRWYKIEPDLNYIQAESCCWAAKEKFVVQDTVRVHISKRLWINDKNKKKCTVSADCGGRNTSSFQWIRFTWFSYSSDPTPWQSTLSQILLTLLTAGTTWIPSLII